DPVVTQLAEQQFWLQPGLMRILHQDARVLLQNDPTRYDVIVGDAFTDIAVPEHLVTQEFLQLVAARLNPGGIYAMNFIDTPARMQALAAMVATFRSVFPSVEIWTEATAALAAALERHGVEYSVKEGDAAFYGPKIDIHVRDAIGRTWQLSTIQCDFNLPERFQLEYVAPDGTRQRPIMLHRALFGSIERFFGVLVEHYAGAFPAWLAPEQVRVLPVAEAHHDYASEVVAHLEQFDIRVDLVEATDPLGKRIRAAKLDKIPYVLVVGDEDVSHRTVGVNPRGSDVERDVPLTDFADRVLREMTVLTDRRG
ncbi:MAG: hypothetical protein EBS76_10745, partial [Actinobacteria bacterium]|nr:hypothetical protein [Actinomycetota bacterium]